jgi:aspartyl/asparaginyl-tRNA synthetase
MYESLSRQGLQSDPYEWYIDLRRQKNYQITSGFGMGIERFIAWSLGHDDIRDMLPYPRLKNVQSFP